MQHAIEELQNSKTLLSDKVDSMKKQLSGMVRVVSAQKPTWKGESTVDMTAWLYQAFYDNQSSKLQCSHRVETSPQIEKRKIRVDVQTFFIRIIIWRSYII